MSQRRVSAVLLRPEILWKFDVEILDLFRLWCCWFIHSYVESLRRQPPWCIFNRLFLHHSFRTSRTFSDLPKWPNVALHYPVSSSFINLISSNSSRWTRAYHSSSEQGMLTVCAETSACLHKTIQTRIFLSNSTSIIRLSCHERWAGDIYLHRNNNSLFYLF